MSFLSSLHCCIWVFGFVHVSRQSCVEVTNSAEGASLVNDSILTVVFSIAPSCYPGNASLETVLVSHQTPYSKHVCQFLHLDGQCQNHSQSQSCSCDSGSGTYSVSVHVDGKEGKVAQILPVTATFFNSYMILKDSMRIALKDKTTDEENESPTPNNASVTTKTATTTAGLQERNTETTSFAYWTMGIVVCICVPLVFIIAYRLVAMREASEGTRAGRNTTEGQGREAVIFRAQPTSPEQQESSRSESHLVEDPDDYEIP